MNSSKLSWDFENFSSILWTLFFMSSRKIIQPYFIPLSYKVYSILSCVFVLLLGKVIMLYVFNVNYTEILWYLEEMRNSTVRRDKKKYWYTKINQNVLIVVSHRQSNFLAEWVAVQLNRPYFVSIFSLHENIVEFFFPYLLWYCS